jgi:hypothetical protein
MLRWSFLLEALATSLVFPAFFVVTFFPVVFCAGAKVNTMNGDLVFSTTVECLCALYR